MRRPLRCYLVRAGTSPRGALQSLGEDAEAFRAHDETVEPLESIDSVPLGDPSPGELIVVTVSSFTATPWWQELLGRELDRPDLAVGPLPTRGAIVFCGVQDPQNPEVYRWLAWTFGTGSRYLDRRKLDPRFGVISALNRIIGEGSEQTLLRKLQYRDQGAYRQRIGHIASNDIPLTGFRMDEVRDLIAAAGGRPPDDESQVFGGRNLVFRTDVTDLLSTVRRESSLAIASYRENRYREHFGFIDNYIPIDGEQLLADLEAVLHSDLVHDRDTVDFVYPDDLVDFNDDRAIEFVLLPNERLNSALRKTLTLDRIRSALSAEPNDDLELTLRFADADQNLLGKAELRECLSAELRLQGERYYLADGVYYQVDPEFIARIDEALDRIPSWTVALPSHQGGSERRWLERAVTSGNFALLDDCLIRLPGRTPFEAADLVHRSGALLHVKRKARSSALSYLFSQASVSSQLLREAPGAVNELRRLIEECADPGLKEPTLESLQALDQSPPNLDIVLCILGDWHQRSLKNLPLIAKLELQATARQIRQRGFRLYVALVPLASRQ